jgi:post-segregation antitoxin (ccd killing protein)
VVAPSSSAEVPDTEGVRLVLLHPKYRHRYKAETSDALSFAQDTYEHRGSANRQHRNTVVFLAPDENEYASLDTAVRDFIAWQDINSQIDDLGLTRQQETQVKARLAESRKAVDLRLSGTYLWALAPEIHEGHAVQWSKQKIGSGGGSLTDRAGAALIRYDALRVVNAPAAIKQALEGRLRARWNVGHITVAELWGYYTQYAYLRRIRDRSVLETGVRAVLNLPTWSTEGFALADGYDEASGDFLGLALPMSNDSFGTITDSTLLVDPRLAEKQREREVAEAANDVDEANATEGRSPGDAEGGTTNLPWKQPAPPRRERAKNVRFTGTFYARAEALRADLQKVYDEVLSHLANVPDSDLEVSVEVIANRAAGF